MKKSILITYDTEAVFGDLSEGDPGDLYIYLLNEFNNTDIMAELKEVEPECSRSEGTRVSPPPDPWVCSKCGSDQVLQDAYVGVNDPTDVRGYDSLYCEACEGECRTVKQSEYAPG